MLRLASFARPPPVLRITRASVPNVSVRGKGSQGFHIEVAVSEDEPDEAALRRFVRSTKASKIMFEVRRRRRFENRQDIRKRKMKERGLFKKLPEEEEWTEVRGVMDPSPFGDMFGDPNDVFERSFEDFAYASSDYPSAYASNYSADYPTDYSY